MGIETSPPDVEESTEPPLPSSSNEGHQELPASALDHPTITYCCLGEGDKVFITPDEVPLKDQTAPATRPDHHREWGEQSPSAPTFTIVALSNVLTANLQ